MSDELIIKDNSGREYLLDDMLGSGSFGIVYKGTTLDNNQSVAVKIARRFIDLPKNRTNPDAKTEPFATDRNKDATIALGREVQALSLLDSNYIPRIYSVGTVEMGLGKQRFFTMEYMEGQDLYEAYNGSICTWKDSLKVVRDVAEALEEVHNADMIHRDIKSSNILITGQGAKLFDFGIALLPGMENKSIFGTPGYISPEYFKSADIDGRSDLFGLGVVAYWMLTGISPFKAETDVESAAKTLTHNPVKLVNFNNSMPEEASRIVMKLLEKDPNNRHKSADQVKEEVDRFLASAGEVIEVTSAFDVDTECLTADYARV